jgi:drug/metabolite transporter (DMT)-like permease
MPLALLETAPSGLAWRADLGWVQLYCILAGGVAAFVLWNNALRHWPTSRVLLFSNLVPLSTMIWAHVWLNEPVTRTFWLAMALVAGGVLLGQPGWRKLLAPASLPPD